MVARRLLWTSATSGTMLPHGAAASRSALRQNHRLSSSRKPNWYGHITTAIVVLVERLGSSLWRQRASTAHSMSPSGLCSYRSSVYCVSSAGNVLDPMTCSCASDTC